MMIVMSREAGPRTVGDVQQAVRGMGALPRVCKVGTTRVVAVLGAALPSFAGALLTDMDGVEKVLDTTGRFILASRSFQPDETRVTIGQHTLGAGVFQIIAGPCAVESRPQLHDAAKALLKAGVGILRAGAFKPRTSPYDFQGLGAPALELLAEVKKSYNLCVVTEVMDPDDIRKTARVADVLQVGTRNAQNYRLLEAVAHAQRPVLLKRGMASRFREWIATAEYLMVNGCNDVILCERGIRTFEDSSRATLDVAAIALAKQETHLPVVVDPSHAAGRTDLVLPLALAGIAAGADGLLVEAHPEPDRALCDASQQMPCAELPSFVKAVEQAVALHGKRFDTTADGAALVDEKPRQRRGVEARLAEIA